MKRKIRAPSHLSAASKRWWVEVCTEYELEGHHVRLLTLAAEAFDRCGQAREALARDGLTVKTDSGGLKAHPCVGIERDSRLAFARLVRELDLDVDAPFDRRPPGLRSNRRP